MDPNYQTCGLCPLGPTPIHSRPWITPYLIPWASPITWLPHCQTYSIFGPMDPIPLNPWVPPCWSPEWQQSFYFFIFLFFYFFFVLWTQSSPFSVVLNSSKLLAYLPVLPWAAGAAEESEVSVDTVAVVDVASDNFAATSLSIHACCASVNDGISTSAGSDIAWSSAAVIMIPSWGSWLVTTKARFVTPRTHAHNFCTCDHPPRVRSSLLTWSN